MSFSPDAEQLQVDATGPKQGRFVFGAVSGHVLGQSVQEMDVARRQVHLAKEMLAHELPVGIRMVRPKANVLVEVEGDHAGEIQSVLGLHPPQGCINPEACSYSNHIAMPGQFKARNEEN